jgi:hypothetical protein
VVSVTELRSVANISLLMPLIDGGDLPNRGLTCDFTVVEQ